MASDWILRQVDNEDGGIILDLKKKPVVDDRFMFKVKSTLAWAGRIYEQTVQILILRI